MTKSPSFNHINESKQLNLIYTPSKRRYCHGGQLRNSIHGRKARPLSHKAPIHLVFKANKAALKSGFRSSRSFKISHFVIRKYGAKFFVKIEQLSLQKDHIHLLVRTSKRSNYQSFFRVVAGQIAQIFAHEGMLKFALMTDTPTSRHNRGCSASTKTRRPLKLWKHRPFTRIVSGFKAIQIVRNYIQLNELEAQGIIPYQKRRFRGLTDTYPDTWQSLLWGNG